MSSFAIGETFFNQKDEIFEVVFQSRTKGQFNAPLCIVCKSIANLRKDYVLFLQPSKSGNSVIYTGEKEFDTKSEAVRFANQLILKNVRVEALR